jgi:2,4-didehydro-3-deoxy-L-rhamnonate hydrolase
LVLEGNELNHIAGYAVFNDVSERAFQIERGSQWTKGKSCDSFAPLGPWLVTADEIPEPGRLEVWLDVNGKRMQHSSTTNLIFSIPALIASLSSYMTLHPGDVIATGTPGGVGLGRKPPMFLGDGDIVELGIAGLGRQRQVVTASV